MVLELFGCVSARLNSKGSAIQSKGEAFFFMDVQYAGRLGDSHDTNTTCYRSGFIVSSLNIV